MGKVVVFSTGDEVASMPMPKPMNPSCDGIEYSPLPHGQIRDSNRYMLMAAATECGCDVVDGGIVMDGLDALRSNVLCAIATGVDMVLTSGGVSMGARDFVKPVMEDICARAARSGGASSRVHFGRVRMKPGKPLTFATVEGDGGARSILLFGL